MDDLRKLTVHFVVTASYALGGVGIKGN